MITGIFVDNRESPSIQGIDWGDIPAAITTLDVGDLWATNDRGELMAFARKTPGDLLGSIADNRLFQQAAGIRERTEYAHLVICGQIIYDGEGYIHTHKKTGWKLESVQGAINAVESVGVRVVQCLGDEAYKTTILHLANIDRSAEKIIPPLVKPRMVTDAENILSGFPGIGLERAQLILRKFEGHLGRAIAWLTWVGYDEEKIAGIGPGTKRRARQALGLSGETFQDDDLEELHVFTHDAYEKEHKQRTEAIIGAMKKELIA